MQGGIKGTKVPRRGRGVSRGGGGFKVGTRNGVARRGWGFQGRVEGFQGRDGGRELQSRDGEWRMGDGERRARVSGRLLEARPDRVTAACVKKI